MTRLDSLAVVTLSASLALYAGPMLTGAISGQRSAVSKPHADDQPTVQDAADATAGASWAATPGGPGTANMPAGDPLTPAAPSGDAAQEAPRSPWLSTLEAAVYTFTKPLVVIVGDRAYADAVRDALGPDEADFAWRRTEGERSVGVLKSRDSELLECSETEPVKVAELLRALE
jgi:hypothetical protein